MHCALCSSPLSPATARPLAGLSVCDPCMAMSPDEPLASHGIAVDFRWQMLRFGASLQIPGVPDDVTFSARPERWTTAVAKLWVAEMEVGDELFDRHIYLRTAGDSAGPLLADEGVQSALLGLLSGTRQELVPNHVTLHGTLLTVSVRPLVPMGEDGFLERQLLTAALALHVKQRFVPAAT